MTSPQPKTGRSSSGPGPKITLSASQDIPFNKLLLSQSNVRRIKAGVSIDELADDIARRTLLQSLSVRAVLGGDGQETGMFEVPAGGRRYRALELLVKQKRLAKTALVPCVIRTEGLAEEDSLAENVQRAPLHPLDQFRAFQAMRDKGRSEEEVAAAFFIPVAVVKQRLRLAAVSEKLLEAYANDSMTLEQLMAFTVTEDHVRQEQVWDAIQGLAIRPTYQIRRLLTATTVPAGDRRVLFIGLDAYTAAGGVVTRDLFEEDGGGYLENIGLLESLIDERLNAEVQAVGAEGWKWVEAAVSFPYGHTRALRELEGIPTDRTAEEQAAMDALQAEQEDLQSQFACDDGLPEAVDARLREIQIALEELETRPETFDPEDVARAGVFISIDSEGRLVVDRGYVRPDDEAPVETESGPDSGSQRPIDETDDGRAADADDTGGEEADSAEEAEPEDDGLAPLSDRLLAELTAHRTLALRDAVAHDPHVAMTLLLHKLCLDTFQRQSAGACLEASIRHVLFSVQPDDLNDSLSAKTVAERHQAWKAELPADEGALWTWLVRLDETSRAMLLAHCISFGVNAIYERGILYGSGVSLAAVRSRLAQADRLAGAVGLDMVGVGWRPTVETYLGRVPKARILEAVREAKGEREAASIAHLKKDDMAKAAERLLAGSGWLPEPLRSPVSGTAAAELSPEPDEAAPLDETAGPIESGGPTDPDGAVGSTHPHAIAAE